MELALGRGLVEIMQLVEQYYTCLGLCNCIVVQPAGFEFVQVCNTLNNHYLSSYPLTKRDCLSMGVHRTMGSRVLLVEDSLAFRCPRVIP
jgi:hypothetical protein